MTIRLVILVFVYSYCKYFALYVYWDIVVVLEAQVEIPRALLVARLLDSVVLYGFSEGLNFLKNLILQHLMSLAI